MLSAVSKHATRAIVKQSRAFASVATVPKSLVPVNNDDRVVLEDDGAGQPLRDPILVARVQDTYYAIEATCPHMNKPLEKGKLLADVGDNPEIRCPIHNTRFDLKTGACTQWVTGVLGYESKLVGGLARKVGGNQRDLQAYTVKENDDGSLTILDNAAAE